MIARCIFLDLERTAADPHRALCCRVKIPAKLYAALNARSGDVHAPNLDIVIFPFDVDAIRARRLFIRAVRRLCIVVIDAIRLDRKLSLEIECRLSRRPDAACRFSARPKLLDGDIGLDLGIHRATCPILKIDAARRTARRAGIQPSATRVDRDEAILRMRICLVTVNRQRRF